MKIKKSCKILDLWELQNSNFCLHHFGQMANLKQKISVDLENGKDYLRTNGFLKKNVCAF